MPRARRALAALAAACCWEAPTAWTRPPAPRVGAEVPPRGGREPAAVGHSGAPARGRPEGAAGAPRPRAAGGAPRRRRRGAAARAAWGGQGELFAAAAALAAGAAGLVALAPRRGGVARELEARLLAKLRERNSGASEAADQELGRLADELRDLRAPFEAARLGGGAWAVAWSTGDLAWQRWAEALPQIAPARPNRSTQTYDVATRGLVNESQLLGDAVRVQVSGVFEEPPAGQDCPVQFEAAVDAGALRCFGLALPLPIKGTGTVNVLYAGERVRVLGSSGDSGYEGKGAVTVQVPLAEWEASFARQAS